MLSDRRNDSLRRSTDFRRTLRRPRAWLRRVDRLVDRRTLSQAEFVKALGRVGIRAGATVCLHSSMDAIARRVPRLTPIALISLLKELLAPDGTLLMPTFPFAGELEYDYVERQRVFDVRRTPSRVGLLTEVFRRTDDVVRSLHPTHSFAGWGRLAGELLRDHHVGTSFGANSPLARMRRFEGLVAGIGVVPKLSFSIFHVAEALHPVSHELQYGTRSFEMRVVDGGAEHACHVIPLRPDRVRRYDRGDRILRREGILRSHRVRGLSFWVAEADRFLDRAHELINAGRFYG